MRLLYYCVLQSELTAFMTAKFETKETNSDNYNLFINEFVNPLLANLESRRKRYLRGFYISFITGLVLTVLSIISFIVLSVSSENIKDILGEGVLRYFDYIWLYFIFPTFAAMAFVSTSQKIIKYKFGDDSVAKNIMLIKQTAYTDLLKFFGKFTFSNNKAVSLYDMQGSNIVPEYLNYYAEDLIAGDYNKVKVEMSEAVFFDEGESQNIAIFKGLVILVDICNSDLMLRSNFKGNTLIIQNDNKDLNFVKTKFSNYDNLSFKDPEIDKRFEILTTNIDEAKQIADEAFLKRIIKISDSINSTSEQNTHLDDKLASFSKNVLSVLGIIIQFMIMLPYNLMSVITLKGFFHFSKEDNFNYNKHYSIYKESNKKSASEIMAFNDDIQCSFYKDKVLITIPHNKNLFEPNSIFEPALVEEDAKILYDIMNLVKQICADIVANKKEAK